MTLHEVGTYLTAIGDDAAVLAHLQVARRAVQTTHGLLSKRLFLTTQRIKR